MISRNLFVLASLLVLSACSGGSGSSPTTPPPVVNVAPVVNAGVDATIRLPADSVALDGTVSDDGLPSGVVVSTVWTVASGPAGATFADANAVDTTVTFVSEGTYVLELTADDTALQGADSVEVIVEAAPVLTIVSVTPATVALLSGGAQTFSESGTDQYGDPIAANVIWSATGGTIDAAGDYTAGNVFGDFTVTATDGAVVGTAGVTISASPPTANAGGPYVGVEGASVALDGSGSTDTNNDIVDYNWDLDNDGAYDDATGVNPTFAAAGSGVFIIGLQVTDADGASNIDSTTVTISNVAPTANAGGPYSGDQGADIVLDGSASSDPGNDIVTYEWDLDNDGAFDNAMGVSATFNSAATGTFTIGLRVTDNDGVSSSVTATVTVGNAAPTANAGPDQPAVTQGDTVTLDGSGSSDPGGDALTYAWTLTSVPVGSAASLSDATVAGPTFDTDLAGVYVAELVVNDGTDDSAADTVTITVGNVAPTANAGPDQPAATQGDTVTLDGSGSSDPGGDALTYAWTLTSVPVGSAASLSDATVAGPTFDTDLAGVYVAELVVNDGTDDSAADAVTITVSDVAPIADAGGPYSGDQDANIALDGSASSDPSGIAAYDWDLDNDSTYETPGVNVNFNSATAGVFTVGLQVTDNDGTSATTTVDITVNVPGPIHAYWKMDEGSPSPTIADTVLPDDGTGTINGATWTTGVSGSALDFNGSSDHVVIDNTPNLNITGTAISLHAWVFPHTGGNADGGRIISKNNDGGGNEVFAMAVNDYRMVFRLDGQDMASSHIVVLNEWVHVAMVYDGTDVRIYINGELDAATPVGKTDPIDASSRAVHLGMWEGQGRYLNGVIDEVQIFDSAVIPLPVLPPARGAGLFFEDITLAAGTSGPVDGGHGVMFAEVDNDTFPDYYLTNSRQGFSNRPDFLFDNTNGSFFAEVAGARNIDDTDGGSHGAVWADLDNDGDYDLVNGTTWDNFTPTTGNPDSDNVFSNGDSLGGSPGIFTDLTATIPDILATKIETVGITAFDMDGDGDLDLFGVPSFAATLGANAAFLNNGSFAFSSVGGVLSTAFAMEGVTDTDFDGDGDIDILTANLFGEIVILENQTAPPDSNPGVFTQPSPGFFGITDTAGTGITTADFDNDEDLDLLLVDNGQATLYRNNGGTYIKTQTLGGIEGYMGGFADIDNDGDLDLIFAGDEKVFIGHNNGIFTLGQSVPVSEIAAPRAIAFADIDSDGDLDFAITAKDSRNWLVRNDIDGAAGNWLRVELVSPQCQAGAFGAMVKVFKVPGDGGQFVTMREAKGNHGYLAQDDPVLHFGLGTIPSVDVVVDWVDIGVPPTIVSAVTANQRILIDACPP